MQHNQYDLPLNKDITARFVPKIVTLMVYLGTLCFVFTLFMLHSSLSWQKQLSTHLSIEMPALNDTASSTLQSKVLDLLKQTPAVQNAAPVPQKEMSSLFRSLLGEEIDIDLFSLPTVIDVTLKQKEHLDIKQLETSLKNISSHVHLTDHRTWQGQIANLIQTSVAATFFITMLIILAALATAIFATKTSLLIHKQVIEVLSLIGATPFYIAKQFQIHALKQALIASAVGSMLAFCTFFGLITLLERAELPCVFDSSFFSQTLCVFILTPFLMALAMMLSARIAVIKALRS